MLRKAFLVGLVFMAAGVSYAEPFKIGIMQDKKGEAAKYAPLIGFFSSKGLDVKLQGYRTYVDAANKFAAGEVDAMFAGSGVAGAMIIKGLAEPLLRPMRKDGWSTYWAVVLAQKPSAPFTGDVAYFQDKKIICSSLASSGEFFARSILGPDRQLMKAGSHGMAVHALARGKADIAIVKNRVWDSMKTKYPDIEQVGKDDGENPDGTFIVSRQADKALVGQIRDALLNIENDGSAEARVVKHKLKIVSYIPTTKGDFSHTLALLKKAGVSEDFNFSY